MSGSIALSPTPGSATGTAVGSILLYAQPELIVTTDFNILMTEPKFMCVCVWKWHICMNETWLQQTKPFS